MICKRVYGTSYSEMFYASTFWYVRTYSPYGTYHQQRRMKQRSVVITLLDLKNAFGEVHHNLIPTVLKYHHIPDQIQQLINNLYSNFHTSVLYDCFRTPFIKVNRVPLAHSPLTFASTPSFDILRTKSLNSSALH